MKNRVLIIEDDKSIIRILSTILTSNDYNVLTAKTGQQALILNASHNPEIILLDLGLPDMDGSEVLKEIRSYSKKPILIISARDTEKEKVRALDLGADDYITKPFGSSELLARMRTSLRHYNLQLSDVSNTKSYSVGNFTIHFEKHCILLDGNEIHLTQIEFKIVELLTKNPGRVLTYDSIMESIWGPYSLGDNKILRVNMANIRRKLEKNPAEPEYIFTEIGIGYRFADNEDIPD